MRPPLRVRLTAAYALVLAAILTAVGAFVVVRLGAGLTAELDGQLRSAAAQLAIGFREDGPPGIPDVATSVLSGRGAAARLVAADGRVLAAYGGPVARLSPADRSRVLRGATVVRSAAGLRVVAAPARRRRATGIVVAAESLSGVRHAVDRVLVALLLAGPAALTATALGGWWLAGRALRPVDRMTARAARIGPERLEERLAVPAADDELARLAATLNAMLDRIERGVRDQQRLVADASHELRTPLATMRAELDVSLRADALSPAARDVLLSTREEADRLSRTVDDLLTLAAADEGGGLGALAVPLDLAEVARAAGGDVVLAGDPAPALGDPERLRHALRNLIENALKFGPPGGRVRVTTWTAGSEAGVTVADDGPGVAPADAERVFDRFYRADAARARGGSGLGLAIVKTVAEAHGGRAWAQGSEFSIALPRYDRATAGTRSAPSTTRHAPATSAMRTKPTA